MGKLWQGDDRQLALSEGSFGVSLLRQAAQRESSLSPAMNKPSAHSVAFPGSGRGL